MRVYRLGKEKYSARVLEGEGGRVASGRWHTQGRRIVYCATSEALAVLEVRVHTGKYAPSMPYAIHAIDVPDACIVRLRAEQLPPDWNAVPFGTASQRIGDEWLTSVRSAALQVPSVHSQSDATMLLNPEHSDFPKVQVVSVAPYLFDRRLFRKRAVARTRRHKRHPTR